jgi:hypothetical protein
LKFFDHGVLLQNPPLLQNFLDDFSSVITSTFSPRHNHFSSEVFPVLLLTPADNKNELASFPSLEYKTLGTDRTLNARRPAEELSVEGLQRTCGSVHSASVDPAARAYITSERFIQDSLVEQTKKLIEELRQVWRRKPASVKAMFFTWPGEVIRDDLGRAIDSTCGTALPEDRKDWSKIMQRMAIRTKAYAALLVDPGEKALRVLLESQHGTHTWMIPIERRGDITALGASQEETDHDSIGLLWKASQLSS